MNKKYEINGYVLHILPTQKFKNITISCKISAPLTKETSTIRTLLSFILVAGTKEYPEIKMFSRHLELMYGARLSSHISTKGKNHVINLTSVCINENFLPEKEDLFLKQIRLFKGVLLEPSMVNGLFDEQFISIKKKELKERLRANNDDKFMYSVEKLYEIMGEDQPLGISGYGYIDEVDSITNEQLSQYFIESITNNQKHIYVVGDVNESIVDIFKQELFFNNSIESVESVVSFNKKNKKVNEVIEIQDITQAKLNMGYSVDCNYFDENHYAFTVFNFIFGGFSQSKLFKTVREKHSLCYYVSSSYDAFNGTMIVNAGIENGDYQKVRSLVENELLNIQEGNVSLDELNLAIKMIKSSLIKSNDDPSSIIAINYNKDLTNKTESNDEYFNKIKNITINDVVRVSNLVSLDTIFLLKGGDE